MRVRCDRDRPVAILAIKADLRVAVAGVYFPVFGCAVTYVSGSGRVVVKIGQKMEGVRAEPVLRIRVLIHEEMTEIFRSSVIVIPLHESDLGLFVITLSPRKKIPKTRMPESYSRSKRFLILLLSNIPIYESPMSGSEM